MVCKYLGQGIYLCVQYSVCQVAVTNLIKIQFLVVLPLSSLPFPCRGMNRCNCLSLLFFFLFNLIQFKFIVVAAGTIIIKQPFHIPFLFLSPLSLPPTFSLFHLPFTISSPVIGLHYSHYSIVKMVGVLLFIAPLFWQEKIQIH